MRICKCFEADSRYIADMTGFVGNVLDKNKVSKKDRNRAELNVEEVVSSLLEHRGDVPADSKGITICIMKILGSLTIEISSEGEKFSLVDNMSSAKISLDDDTGTDAQDIIRNIILKSNAGDIKYRHKSGKNFVRMTVLRSGKMFLYQTVGALFLALVVGVLLSNFGPENVNTFLNEDILIPIKTMYMNALKMVVAPVVFFSIISCVAQFTNLSELGRIGGKILSLYLFTTVIASLLGIGLFFLIDPVSNSMAGALNNDTSSITSQTIDMSVKDMLVGIIPTDIIDPFLKSNMLQLIFMAVLLGIATGLCGKYSEMLRELFQALNDLFLKVTSLIIKIMPIAVFCSAASMILTLGVSVLLSVLAMFGTFVLGLAGMMIIYCILILIVGKMSPGPFIRKYPPYMLQVFSMSSSNAAIPVNMEACEKKLGIDKTIYTLSIPLGSTVNMDGTCVYLGVFSLALAKTYGIDISGTALISLIMSIIVLSIGAPGIPGAGLICLSVLLAQLNVPVEAVGIVMGIDAICAMFRAMSNSTGDVAVSAIVAKSEKRLNTEVYKE